VRLRKYSGALENEGCLTKCDGVPAKFLRAWGYVRCSRCHNSYRMGSSTITTSSKDASVGHSSPQTTEQVWRKLTSAQVAHKSRCHPVGEEPYRQLTTQRTIRRTMAAEHQPLTPIVTIESARK